MSITAFVQHGEHRGLLGVTDTKLGDLPWPIEVYDINEDDTYGTKYPDGARQAQPRKWWPQYEQKLLELRAAAAAAAKPHGRPALLPAKRARPKLPPRGASR